MSTSRFKFINDKSYQWNVSRWLTDVNTYPADILYDELKSYMGHIADCSRVNSKINDICNQLEHVFKLPVDAQIFFAPNEIDTTGFGIHNDLNHNMIIQVEGVSNIKIWDYPNQTDLIQISSLDYEPMIDVIMQPGDLAFVPFKYWHSVTSKTKRLSFSFSVAYPNNYSDMRTDDFQTREWLDINRLLDQQ